MRVVTFQDKYVIQDMLHTDVFRFVHKQCRSKEIDYDKSKNLYPIYGFASIPCFGTSGLNMFNILTRWTHLVGFYRLDRRDMVELEVPDNFIIKIRTANSNIDISNRDIYNYVDDEIEVVLYEVRKEWIVAVHESDNNDTVYGKRDVSVRIISNWHKPLIYKDYWVSGSSIDNELESKLPDVPPVAVRCKDLSSYVNENGFTLIMKDLFRMYMSEQEASKYFEDADESVDLFNEYVKRFDNVIVCY